MIEWTGFFRADALQAPLSTTLCFYINECVMFVSFHVLLNGKPKRSFKPERELRQGDPLSPFSFTICAEGLSGLIRKSVQNQSLQQNAPEIIHLLIADDNLIFAEAKVNPAELFQ